VFLTARQEFIFQTVHWHNLRLTHTVWPHDAPSIVVLLFICFPLTVRWLVVPVRVPSAEGHADWARPHIFEKQFEANTSRFQPTGTNLDAASSPRTHSPSWSHRDSVGASTSSLNTR
jgi:hypothetical protein